MWQFGPPNRQWRRWFRGRRGQRGQRRGCCHKQGTDEAQKRENGQDGSQEANHGQTIPENGLDIADAFTEERSTWTRGLTRSCRGWCCRSTSACFAALSTYRWRSCWGMGSRPARGSPRRDRSDCWAPLDGGGHSAEWPFRTRRDAPNSRFTTQFAPKRRAIAAYVVCKPHLSIASVRQRWFDTHHTP